MMLFLILCSHMTLLCLPYLVMGQDDDNYPVVRTANGQIRGKILKLTNGLEVAAFLGIPFAEPPVGPLRFKPPVPKAPWDEVFNATSFGPLCSQSKHRSHWDIVMEPNGLKVLRRLGLWDYQQGEDCLNLNIYVPFKALPDKNPILSNLPIMFFIHGGSYKTNGGRFYPGEWLASAGEVIVVTVNYRLGVLGFLSTQDENAKGNYGLLDQILALKWIQEHIENFGGKPTDVTIFGNSAGGACVGLHLISPMSRGLFSKAIAQSGSPIGEWAVQRKPRMYVERLARKLKCPDVNDSAAILECLRKVSPEEILDKSEDAKSLEDSLMLQFAPVIDGVFLLDQPNIRLQQEGSLSSVPVIVGVTRDELEVWMTKSYQDKDPSSIPFTKDLLRKYLLHLVRNDRLSDVAEDVLLHAVYTEYVYEHGTTSNHKKKRKEQQKMSNGTLLYHDNQSSVLPDIRTLGKIISDIDLKAPSVKLVNLLALHPNTSVYMYEFDYASSDDVIVSKYVGSYHESELYYIFGFPHMNLSNALRLPQDREVSDIMIQLWTDFAKTSNPTPKKTDLNNVVKNFTWTPYTEDEDCFATLGLQPFIARSYETERMSFWNHFIPLFTEYPIHITSNRSESSSTAENCTADIFVLFAYIGWILFFICFLCLSAMMYLYFCGRIKMNAMQNLAIPV
ncbi:pyrethroid hydrolase Ces2e isoform X3 [Parasteatoda tepidariorum]|uniref:pyrethroid hydrolase Ces2e isoform X3 n=1 Tax=Parasteatoda tepidariorum TaxID=114398 RepID=UPI0039BD53FD